MSELLRYPLLVFSFSFLALSIAAWVGATVLRRQRELEDGAREDFGVVLAATLTLLGLILGFSFSMAWRCSAMISTGETSRSFMSAAIWMAERSVIGIMP